MDNCEHLLRAVAGLVLAIEAAGPGVRVLATSREGLNVAGEQLIQVPSLGLPEDDPGLNPVECESVRLFAERARLVKADFEIDAANQGDVVAVCRRLDGVALVIELTAARVQAMTPSELLGRLDRRFRQYGEERLAEAGEADARRARHADHFIDFAATSTPNMYGPAQLEWGARLARERDNFQAAMAFALASDDVDRAMGLLCQTPVRFNQADQQVVFDPDLILALTGAREHPGSSRALYEAGFRLWAAGDYTGALEMADQAEAAWRRLGPAPGYEHTDMLCLYLRPPGPGRGPRHRGFCSTFARSEQPSRRARQCGRRWGDTGGE